jgi:membrane protease YdiL (CAAX protease family)
MKAAAYLAACRTPRGKAIVILAVSPWLLAVCKCFANPATLQRWLIECCGSTAYAGWGAVASMLVAFLLLGVAPLAIVRGLFGERVEDYGVGLGHPVRTVRTFLIILPFVLAGAWASRHDAAIAAIYPLNPAAGDSSWHFVGHAAAYFAFYMGWEFHFRGFYQHGLAPHLGLECAVLTQTLASGLAHFDKPPAELLASIAGGVLLGVLAVRTRSILSGLLLHATLGIAIDLFQIAGRS